MATQDLRSTYNRSLSNPELGLDNFEAHLTKHPELTDAVRKQDLLHIDALLFYKGLKINVDEIIAKDLTWDEKDGNSEKINNIRNNIRLLISPDDNERSKTTRYLRKQLFSDPSNGEKIIKGLVESLESYSDYENFILFIIRDKQRRKCFFNQIENLQALVEGKFPVSWMLTDLQVNCLRRAFINALTSVDSTVMNWMNNSKLTLSKEAVYQIIANADATNKNTILDNLWFFVRNKGRMQALVQSDILNAAAQSTENPSLAIINLKSVMFPVCAELNAKLTEDKLWRKLYNPAHYESSSIFTIAINLFVNCKTWFLNWLNGSVTTTLANGSSINIKNTDKVMHAMIEQQKVMAALKQELQATKKANVDLKTTVTQLSEKVSTQEEEQKVMTGLKQELQATKKENDDLKITVAQLSEKVSTQEKEQKDVLNEKEKQIEELKAVNATSQEQVEKQKQITLETLKEMEHLNQAAQQVSDTQKTEQSLQEKQFSIALDSLEEKYNNLLQSANDRIKVTNERLTKAEKDFNTLDDRYGWWVNDKINSLPLSFSENNTSFVPLSESQLKAALQTPDQSINISTLSAVSHLDEGKELNTLSSVSDANGDVLSPIRAHDTSNLSAVSGLDNNSNLSAVSGLDNNTDSPVQNSLSSLSVHNGSHQSERARGQDNYASPLSFVGHIDSPGDKSSPVSFNGARRHSTSSILSSISHTSKGPEDNSQTPENREPTYPNDTNEASTSRSSSNSNNASTNSRSIYKPIPFNLVEEDPSANNGFRLQ